ncbi:MAG: hypothetical protein J5606_09575 [Bacteroidales bacterium]|nr:hypothetical protein [Bacteroidales bacterium]
MLFSEILVSQHLKDILINTVKSKRISHAQLFLGQQGTHSLGLAIAYCQYIACQNRTETDACGQCPSCVKFNNLTHPDLHFFFPNVNSDKIKQANSLDYYEDWRNILKSNKALISYQQWVDVISAGNKQPEINVRDSALLLEQVMLKPYESEYKFFIIWLPEKMNTECANKLLKTLEEPDGKTLIILVSEDYEKVLGTIQSRTQLFKINRLPSEDFIKIVAQHIDCDESIAEEIASLTDFNLQQALQLGVNIVNVDYFQKVCTMMRCAYRLVYLKTGKIDIDFATTDKLIKELVALGREKQKDFLSYSLNLIRKCILLSCNAEDLVKCPQQESEWLYSFAPFVNATNGQYMVEVFTAAMNDIANNGNPTIVFTDMFFQIGQVIRMGDPRLNK